jgi:hypothetical protein
LQSTGDEALDKSEIAASVNIVELEHSSSVPAVFTIPHETSVVAKLKNPMQDVGSVPGDEEQMDETAW